MYRLQSAITCTLAVGMLVSLSACESGPRRVDPTGDEKVVTAGVDYDEIIEWSSTLSQRMLIAGFLEGYEQPVPMVVSDIENKTNLSNFPKEVMIGRIRSSMLNSGKVRYISTYGKDGTDDMTLDSGELNNDPRFKKPDWNKQEGSLTVARLSLRTQILYVGARNKTAQQNTYEVRMFVTDVANGEVVWEGFSDPISKVTRKSGIGF